MVFSVETRIVRVSFVFGVKVAETFPSELVVRVVNVPPSANVPFPAIRLNVTDAPFTGLPDASVMVAVINEG